MKELLILFSGAALGAYYGIRWYVWKKNRDFLKDYQERRK
jgi:hypothetical protein